MRLCGGSGFFKRAVSGGAALLLAVALTGSLPVRAAGERMLVPVGHTVGIKLFARGVVVAKLPDGRTPARACGLRAGDVILSCDGREVTSTEQFQRLLQERGEEGARLEVQRSRRRLELPVEPTRNEQGVYCIGAWVRDSMAGIGTMTYYDPADGSFGALGHGITDVDTALLMPFSNGSILPSAVKAVKRGAVGSAGELRGRFDLTGDLGPLYANTSQGIFGKLTGTERPSGKPVPVGEAAVGPATILANVEGDEVKTYAVEILEADPHDPMGHHLLLAVKDAELLSKTGGIVQGMSGSPIMQKGKLVGAVTHVLLNDPTKGYGISMDSMLKAAE